MYSGLVEVVPHLQEFCLSYIARPHAQCVALQDESEGIQLTHDSAQSQALVGVANVPLQLLKGGKFLE
jgi:hypothetical protein